MAAHSAGEAKMSTAPAITCAAAAMCQRARGVMRTDTGGGAAGTLRAEPAVRRVLLGRLPL
ncbi:hypothetical protein FBZ91_111118 [Nitrospirillum viridazoti]|nr:hypothetical protein FBZ91_111118 [Nitrospirillum amazonense]